MRKILLICSFIILSAPRPANAAAEWIADKGPAALRVGGTVTLDLNVSYKVSKVKFLTGFNNPREPISGILEYSRVGDLVWIEWGRVENAGYGQVIDLNGVVAKKIRFTMKGGGGADGLISFSNLGSGGWAVYGELASPATDVAIGRQNQGVAVTSIKGYGIDYSDKSGVCFFADFPNIRMDDVPTRCKAANASWTGDYEIGENVLVLKIKNLVTSAAHSLGVGYTVSLKGATFENGGNTQDIILHKSIGAIGRKESQAYVEKRVTIIPLGKPDISVTASIEAEENVLTAGKKATLFARVRNAGDGNAQQVAVNLTIPSPGGISMVQNSKIISELPAGASQSVSFALAGENDLREGRVPITVGVTAAGGFKAKTTIELQTRPKYTQPKFPADLYVENVLFSEPSGNNALDGYETGWLTLDLINRGTGEAQNVKVSISPLGAVEHLTWGEPQIIATIPPKSTNKISFSFAAAGKIASAASQFRVQVAEEFGFDADPVQLRFNTLAYTPPDLRIEKVAINDKDDPKTGAYGNGNSIIEPNESVTVTAFIQNFGQGAAEGVVANVRVVESGANFNCPDDGKEFKLGTIAPGDYKPIDFYFYTSKRYTGVDLPIKIELTESRGDFGKTMALGLKMNQRTPNVVDVNVAKIEVPKASIRPIAEAAQSDIDKDPPESKTKRPNGWAVVIGIEKYKDAPAVTFAERDALAFLNYARNVLGIPDRNIYFLQSEGATLGEFSKLFGTDGWLAKRTTTDSDVFVYYCGHGAPGLADKSPYLIPYDIDPDYATSAYALSQLYENLHGITARTKTVFLDACFSGQTREKEMLLADARPVFVTVSKPTSYTDITVIAATNGTEVSSGDAEERHGIFTYYLLKGLGGEADSNEDGAITVGELYNYLKPKVHSRAANLDREQTPTLLAGDLEQILVKR